MQSLNLFLLSVTMMLYFIIWNVSCLDSTFAGDILRIPEHFHDHDEEYGEYLQIETLSKPKNCEDSHIRKSKLGDNLQVHYIGYIDESSAAGRKGQIIDQTKGTPLTFRLGAGQVVRGWDEGLTNMCVGEKRRLTIPPSFGYGQKGTKGGLKGTFIPPGTTLRFDVELVGFHEKRQKQNFFVEIDTDQDGRLTYQEMEYWYATKHPKKLQSIPPGVWEKDDRNQDGYISWDEFSGPKGALPRAVIIDQDGKEQEL